MDSVPDEWQQVLGSGIWMVHLFPGERSHSVRGSRVGGQNALFGEVFDFLRIITSFIRSIPSFYSVAENNYGYF